ncbi:MAG: CBS domain-containing protein [Gammaproteobacteria bacterium]|nr:CBS domain-containing protein [Gammaproteobacteria bacterium]
MLHSIAVKDYMAEAPLTFTPEMDVMEAIELMVENRFSGAPVLDKLGNIVGILSEKDCLKVALNASYHGTWGGKVGEFMSPNVVTVDADTSILDVARRFLETPYKRFPVLSDNRLVGQISRGDVLRAIDTLAEEPVKA